MTEQELDDALAQTFPASDPLAQTQAFVHVGLKSAVPTTPGATRR